MKYLNPEFIIYIVGIAFLGFFYSTIKEALGGKLIFLSSVVFYLVILRLAGRFFAKKWLDRNK